MSFRLVLALLVGLSGCEPGVPMPPSSTDQREEARQNVRMVADALQRGSYRSACGRTPNAPFPRAVILINAHQCLSCRDLGYMMRRISESLGEAEHRTMIVLPARDTAAVCAFLRQERIPIQAVTVWDRDNVLQSARSIAVFTTNETLEVNSMYAGPTGTDILRQISE